MLQMAAAEDRWVEDPHEPPRRRCSFVEVAEYEVGDPSHLTGEVRQMLGVFLV